MKKIEWGHKNKRRIIWSNKKQNLAIEKGIILPYWKPVIRNFFIWLYRRKKFVESKAWHDYYVKFEDNGSKICYWCGERLNLKRGLAFMDARFFCLDHNPEEMDKKEWQYPRCSNW